MTQTQVIVDANKQIMGRMASEVAQILLNEQDKEVIIVNADKAIVTGNKRDLIEKYRSRAELRTATNPLAGPFYPRSPEGLIRRSIRGMLPWKKHRGREAFRRLKVYVGVPKSIKTDEFVQFEQADGSNLKSKHLSIADLVVRIGGKL